MSWFVEAMIVRVTLFILSLASQAAFSAVVAVSGLADGTGVPPDRAIVTSSGALVSTGFAGVGVFSISDEAVDLLVVNQRYSELIAAFRPVVGTDDFQSGLVSQIGSPAVPGFFYVSDDIDPVASGLSGATIYSFFGDGPSLAESMELGLFRHSLVMTSNLDQQGFPMVYGFDLADGDLLVGILSGSQVVSIPQLGVFNQPFPTMSLEAVPESGISSCFLTMASMLGFCRRRERRSA